MTIMSPRHLLINFEFQHLQSSLMKFDVQTPNQLWKKKVKTSHTWCFFLTKQLLESHQIPKNIDLAEKRRLHLAEKQKYLIQQFLGEPSRIFWPTITPQKMLGLFHSYYYRCIATTSRNFKKTKLAMVRKSKRIFLTLVFFLSSLSSIHTEKCHCCQRHYFPAYHSKFCSSMLSLHIYRKHR